MTNEFLVHIRFLPDELDDDSHSDLVDAELQRAAELTVSGNLLRMWRVPGRRENWGIWTARDVTHLHEILTSLPFWPYMDLDVQPLARHAVDPLYGTNQKFGALCRTRVGGHLTI